MDGDPGGLWSRKQKVLNFNKMGISNALLSLNINILKKISDKHWTEKDFWYGYEASL